MLLIPPRVAISLALISGSQSSQVSSGRRCCNELSIARFFQGFDPWHCPFHSLLSFWGASFCTPFILNQLGLFTFSYGRMIAFGPPQRAVCQLTEQLEHISLCLKFSSSLSCVIGFVCLAHSLRDGHMLSAVSLLIHFFVLSFSPVLLLCFPWLNATDQTICLIFFFFPFFPSFPLILNVSSTVGFLFSTLSTFYF